MADYVISSGTAKKIALYAGDTMGVIDSGVSKFIKIHHGGTESVSSGGIASSSDVYGGGGLFVASGGISYFAHIERNGVVSVTSGGVAIGTKLNLSNETVFSGGTARNTIVVAGNLFISGGRGERTSVGIKSDEIVYSGGMETAASIMGGFQILRGGSTGRTIIGDEGGVQVISSGGVAKNTILEGIGGGQQYVESGGKAENTIIKNSTLLAVDNGGIAKHAMLEEGANCDVSSGGVIKEVTIDGGVLYLAPGSKVLNGITFSGTDNTLTIDKKSSLDTVISNFSSGDQIVFFRLMYGGDAKAIVKQAGIVTVFSEGKTYNLHIAGAVVGEADFVVSSGGNDALVLTKSPPAQMAFLRPEATPPATAFEIAHTALTPKPAATAPSPWNHSAVAMLPPIAKPDSAHALILSATTHPG